MTDAQIIAALRCSSSVIDSPNCSECPYQVVEKYLGHEITSCDVDRIGHDAADWLEELTLQESQENDMARKYRHAITVLQAIAQRNGYTKYGGSKYIDEWTEAEAFRDCRAAAIKALKYLGENIIMDNHKKGVST